MKPILSVAIQGAAVPTLMGILSLNSNVRTAASRFIPISPQAALFAGILGTVNGIGNEILDRKFTDQPLTRRVLKAVLLINSTALLLASRPHIAMATFNAWKIATMSSTVSPLFEIIYLKAKGKPQSENTTTQTVSEAISKSSTVKIDTETTVKLDTETTVKLDTETSTIKTELSETQATTVVETETSVTESSKEVTLTVETETTDTTTIEIDPEDTKPKTVDIAQVLPVKETEMERSKKLKYIIYSGAEKVFLGFKPTELDQILKAYNISAKLVDDNGWVKEKENAKLAELKDNVAIHLLNKDRYQIYDDGTVKVWFTRVRTLLHLMIAPSIDTPFDELKDEQILALRKTINKVVAAFDEVYGSEDCYEHMVEEEIDEENHKTAFAYEMLPSMFSDKKSDFKEKIKAHIYIQSHGEYEHKGIKDDRFQELTKALTESFAREPRIGNREQNIDKWSYKEVNIESGNQLAMEVLLDIIRKIRREHGNDLIYALEVDEPQASEAIEEKNLPVEIKKIKNKLSDPSQDEMEKSISKGCTWCLQEVIDTWRLVEGKLIDIFAVPFPDVNLSNRHFTIVPQHHLESASALTDEEILEEHRTIVNLRKTAKNLGIHEPSKIFRKHGLLGVAGSTHNVTQVLFSDNFQTKDFLLQKGENLLRSLNKTGKRAAKPILAESREHFVKVYNEVLNQK